MVQFNEQFEPSVRPTVWFSEWFVVYAETGTWLVSRETARQLRRALARPWPRRWVRFRDVSGAVIRVRKARIQSLEPGRRVLAVVN